MVVTNLLLKWKARLIALMIEKKQHLGNKTSREKQNNMKTILK